MDNCYHVHRWGSSIPTRSMSVMIVPCRSSFLLLLLLITLHWVSTHGHTRTSTHTHTQRVCASRTIFQWVLWFKTIRTLAAMCIRVLKSEGGFSVWLEFEMGYCYLQNWINHYLCPLDDVYHRITVLYTVISTWRTHIDAEFMNRFSVCWELGSCQILFKMRDLYGPIVFVPSSYWCSGGLKLGIFAFRNYCFSVYSFRDAPLNENHIIVFIWLFRLWLFWIELIVAYQQRVNNSFI